MRTYHIRQDIISEMQDRVRILQRRLIKAENDKWQSIPVYDLPGSPPAEAVRCQIALDLSGKLWWYYPDEWKTC